MNKAEGMQALEHRDKQSVVSLSKIKSLHLFLGGLTPEPENAFQEVCRDRKGGSCQLRRGPREARRYRQCP
ncbi:hypothetical protein C1H46_030183 [Malus baccata]|uniref:Uncharacterized protein n=1 Tax=Malus baccata TaxID=106549 RepID=A0A540LD94_MALBA|nr:hypothetical protein C1H46_030183 [Malus baccata]